jgi:hypothetical protein
MRQRRIRDLARRRQNADRDREIVAARLLGQVGGREIDGDLARRKFELRVLQRSAHAIARLLDLGVRKPDEIERGKPAGEMNLDGDERGVETREPARQHDRKRHGGSPRVITPTNPGHAGDVSGALAPSHSTA